MPTLANRRHELYAQGLASGKSADEAYALAGFRPNRGNACRLKAHENIAARVAEILAAAADEVMITKARVLAELGKIGFSDVRRLFDAGGALKRVEDLDDEAAGCLASIEVVTKKMPGSEDNEVEHTAKLKLWDKRAALVDIGKHLGMFTEKHEHTGKDGGPIQVEDLSDMDALRRVRFLMNKAKREAPTIN